MPPRRQRQSGRSNREQRAAGYCRRSTDRQEQSIPDQKHAIDNYCKEEGLVLKQFFIDDAISGTKATNRPAFQEMIAASQQPNCDFGLVVVYDVKRFGRLDNDEAGYYRHVLRQNGVEVLYVSEGFDGGDTDDLLRPVKQWQARQESKDLSKVTIRGLLSKADTGYWMGGCPPYGYDLRYEDASGKFLFTLRYLPDGSKQLFDEQRNLTRELIRGESLSISKQDRAKLLPSCTERVEVLGRIFKMYANEGKGYKAIAMTLNADDVPTPRGPQWSRIYSGKWTDTTIRAILVNPIYTGDMVWNRRTDARFHKISDGRAVERAAIHGHRLVPNDETDWIIVRDAHPALIDRRLADQVKRSLDGKVQSIEQRGKNPRLQTESRTRNHGKTWQGKRSRFILSGLLTCALCGNRYQGFHRIKGKNRWDGSRVKTYAYGCGGHITKGNSVCQMNPIPQEVLEDTVIEAVRDFYWPYLEPGGKRRLAEAVRAQLGTEADDLVAAGERIREEQVELDGIINNLLDNLTAENREFVDKRLADLRERQEKLKMRDEELERMELAQASIDSTVEEAVLFLKKLDFILREGLPQEKLVAIRQCVERVWIDKIGGSVKVGIRTVPGGGLEGACQVAIPFK